MTPSRAFEIFLATQPGLELALKDEALALGLPKPKATPGGVRFRGHWSDVWRANLHLRGAGRVLARVARFQAMHLTQLEKLAGEVNWPALLRADHPVTVEASCKRSKINHTRAAAQRVENAIAASLGAPIGGENALRVYLRIENNACTLSLDTSGEPLHKRGAKPFVGKAPLRESMAALFLRQCGYDGTGPVLDPMCGSGTFVIEAAEIAMGLAPGRARSFAFERLAGFDPDAFAALRTAPPQPTPDLTFHGLDRDAGAIRGAATNAVRSGVDAVTRFTCQPVGELTRPDGPPGLVMINPPYGTRIGDKRALFGLYGALGKTLKQHFTGWRVGLVTSDTGLARATALPFAEPGPPVAHGGLQVRLWHTDVMP